MSLVAWMIEGSTMQIGDVPVVASFETADILVGRQQSPNESEVEADAARLLTLSDCGLWSEPAPG